MKSIFGNILLVVALSAVIIMGIGVVLFEYSPTSIAIAKPNTYEVDSSTTKILADIKEDSKNLYGESDISSDNATADANIILQTYDVTSADLQRFRNIGAYKNGKADPFKETKTQTTTETANGSTSSNGSTQTQGTTSSTTSSGGTNNTTSQKSDGTLFNSTSKK